MSDNVVIVKRGDVLEWWNISTDGKPVGIIASEPLPVSPLPNAYVSLQQLDYLQRERLITEQRETRRALERLIALVESWQGDGK